MMFEDLKHYPVVLVTGPLRSGTTICGRMIAHDTGHRYVDETDWGDVDYEQFRKVIDNQRDIVVQCPGIAQHLTPKSDLAKREDLFVIIMTRFSLHCQQSLERHHGKEWAKREAEHYGGDTYAETAYNKLVCLTSVVLRFQNTDVISYKDLERHPLWVPAKKREGWGVKQWRGHD